MNKWYWKFNEMMTLCYQNNLKIMTVMDTNIFVIFHNNNLILWSRKLVIYNYGHNSISTKNEEDIDTIGFKLHSTRGTDDTCFCVIFEFYRLRINGKVLLNSSTVNWSSTIKSAVIREVVLKYHKREK